MNVEHEEVLLVPRWVDCSRVTFKYGLGDEFIEVLAGAAQDRARLDRAGARARTSRWRRATSSPPRSPTRPTLGDRMHGKTCAGTWVTGTGKDGAPRARSTCTTSSTTSDCMREYGHQAVVWQTAINPVVALELLATGAWSGAGVLGPEAFDAVPFLDLLDDYGSPVGHRGPAARVGRPVPARLSWPCRRRPRRPLRRH